MKRVVLAVTLALPVFSFAADKNADGPFFKHAAEAGISEVAAGKLAQSKGNTQAVRDFGAMMVKDHSDANAKLKAIADAEDVKLPTDSSVTQMAEKAKLDLLTGETFDKAYIRNQIKGHRETLTLLKQEIATGTDPQAKSFASDVLPTVEGHLAKIRQIASDEGVTK
jgi:putative membrane protein